ncbi:flagellar export chaperone FliS [Pseudodesulfovibrio piezophilus]|uniref:Flagellar protein FliS n=1 Tax=Pseudodesulfovibrio piezophilus (strain DSM 21447 / JCM 15486 / C1TLV30) TaxID=1322246 RepID=M1WNT9_PSEP2|nr:flagellar export chaperone FliS [Pseudodesulfovibrio piezophilus]CCH50585.1 Flagellar protein FliS [Pseudodesulfovibrio piezophilus C1TLV30]
MANPARAYLATQVETTTQGELLIMLYDAAIKFLKRAKLEIDNKDFAKKGIYISKAMAIIHELSESLNKEKGGEITPRLAQLYMFCTSQLLKANIRLDKKMIDDVIKILDGIRSAYVQIVPTEEGKAAPGDSRQISAKGTEPMAPSVPVAPPIMPQSASPAQPSAPQKTQTQPKPTTGEQPTPPQNEEPAKLRSAFNAAKFRAANAYSNNNG